MTRTYLWYSPATSVTGRALAQYMGLTRTSPSSSDRQYGTRIPPTGTTHVICWGAREPHRWKEYRRRNLRRRIVLNNPFYTEKYKNKYAALYKMYIDDVSVPRFTRNKHEVFTLFDNPTAYSELDERQIIGRTKYHYGGSGFKFIENMEQLRADNQSDYWMEYIGGEDKREYRVHVFNGEVVRVQRKKPLQDEGGEDIEPRSYTCRSHSNGWRFSLCDIHRVHSSIKENSIRAVSALNLDFGAVDVIRVPSTDTTVALEVNTGMGLDSAGIEFYSSLLSNWIEDN